MPMLYSRSPPRRLAAFTLIELLFVLAILGILIAMSVMNFAPYRKRPHDLAALTCGEAIVQQQVTYRSEHPTYAATLAQLGSDVVRPCSTVQVAATPPGSVDAVGTASLAASDSDYAFYTWHQQGLTIYQEDYATHIKLQPLPRTP